MKKLLYIILLTLMINKSYSQVADTCFTKQTLISVVDNVKKLKYRDSVNTKLIPEFQKLTDAQSTIIRLDSIEIKNLKIQKDNLSKNSEDYKKLADAYKPKWYEKPWISFLAGFVTYGIINKW